MSSKITPEMVTAWSTLQDFARRIGAEPLVGKAVRDAAEAIDVLDNSDFMVPIERVRDGEGPMREDRRP